MRQNKSSKAAWAVFASFAAVTLLLVLFFLTQKPSEDKDGIVLPGPSDFSQQEVPSEPDAETDTDFSGFLEVTDRNVLSALHSLSRPAAYRQSSESSGLYPYTFSFSGWLSDLRKYPFH